jgi:hypothetical protein
MSVRQARAVCDMQPRPTPEDTQTEGPPQNATTEIAPRPETYAGAPEQEISGQSSDDEDLNIRQSHSALLLVLNDTWSIFPVQFFQVFV